MGCAGPLPGTVERVLTARLAGQEIDLIAGSAYCTNGAFVRRGALVRSPGKSGPTLAKIEESALNASTIGGEICGAPITSMSTSTICYNVDLFARPGIPDHVHHQPRQVGDRHVRARAPGHGDVLHRLSDPRSLKGPPLRGPAPLGPEGRTPPGNRRPKAGRRQPEPASQVRSPQVKAGPDVRTKATEILGRVSPEQLGSGRPAA